MPRLALALPCLLAAASPALADPPVDSRGYLTLNGSSTLDGGDVSFGLGALEWGRRPSAGVNDVVSATLVAAVGLRLGPIPLELGASMPFAIASGAVDTQGLGDAGFHGKVRLARHVAAIGSVYAPTASDGMGGGGRAEQLLGVVDANVASRLRLGLSGGVRRATSLGMETTSYPLGAAAAWSVSPEKFEVIGEVASSLGDRRTLEALAGVKLYLAKNSYLSLGVGRGLSSGTPDQRALIGIVFEPRAAARRAGRVDDPPREREPAVRVAKNDFPDRDNDGIRDDLDQCPDDPENYNGFEDDDGCPDDDRNASILDLDDPCRIDPAKCTRDRVIVKKTEIVILQTIEFEFDSAKIRPISHRILDAVVQALRDNPDIQFVEVEGHTDERGDDAYNLGLSQRRAAAVVTYLRSHGIDADRLSSEGYGETRPVDLRHTEAAWAKNRRVEFRIRKRGGIIQ
ncbi:MAG: OmpA family protein [Deltaproteobacteria bacterium]|nr:OmpA family protein [Deltaproteobacteria bacterium]MCW5807299.1 OmpA family protein [Deltaproteobacteria bacterium]